MGEVITSEYCRAWKTAGLAFNNVTDALRNVPGVVPSDSNRTLFNNPTIRGFGGGFDFGTDVYRRNGLRDGQGASNTGDTANIERIEVLKGPSSVLYGQGSPGGIINLVTKQPLSKPFLVNLTQAVSNTSL